MVAQENAGVDVLENIIFIDNNNENVSSGADACVKDVKGFSTENAVGELWSPNSISDVRDRAAEAGKRFFAVFSKNA